jgi:hypothetical protein
MARVSRCSVGWSTGGGATYVSLDAPMRAELREAGSSRDALI